MQRLELPVCNQIRVMSSDRLLIYMAAGLQCRHVPSIVLSLVMSKIMVDRHGPRLRGQIASRIVIEAHEAVIGRINVGHVCGTLLTLRTERDSDQQVIGKEESTGYKKMVGCAVGGRKA